jgi:hypothetical protein
MFGRSDTDICTDNQGSLDVAAAGTEDMYIPTICQTNAIGTLITVNHKDFGAKKAIYLALLAAGVHIVVVRPGKMRLSIPNQASVLSMQYPHFSKLIRESEVHILVRITPSDIKARTLNELVDEFDQ